MIVTKDAYPSNAATTDSKMSKAFGSVFLPASNLWNTPSTCSSCLFSNITRLALGTIAERNLAQPGTLPRVSQTVGAKIGPSSVLKLAGNSLDGVASMRAEKIWKT